MYATKCPSSEELMAYAVGRLPDDTSDEIADHLDRCTDCQAAIATLDDADDTFVTTLRHPPADDSVVNERACHDALARAVAVAQPHPGRGTVGERTMFSRVGEELGEYRLLDEIGHGGMGRVYRALQTKLDRIVALKVLPSHRSEDRRAIARFEREMKAIGRLDHPHIVRAYDAREIDGKPVLAMEYVEGLDLARVLLSLGKVRPADACELIRQAALGLQYAHENGLVHRDIKPSNLMLTPHGTVKLLDLGLARFEHPTGGGDEMTGAGQPMGTADYMAPEQVSDSRVADIRADIYSLGCTLFKLLTGHAPFSGPEGRGTFDKLTAHVNDPPPSILEYEPGLPPELAQLVERMLAKSPDDRPATPAELASALEPHCGNSELAGLESLARNVEQQHSSFYDRQFTPPPYPLPPSKDQFGIVPQPRSSWLWPALTALVLVVGLGGFALGVIITIKRNGKETTLDVPDGATVAIDEQAKVGVQLPGKSTKVAVAQPSDFEAIQGAWRIVQRSGKAEQRGLVRSPQWQNSRIEFGGNRVRVFGEGELPGSYEYQINPDASPKMIDVFVAGDELKGVYELDGDHLKICFDWGGHNEPSRPNVRPQSVWAGLNSDQEMFVLQRMGTVIRYMDEEAIQGAWSVVSADLKIKADPSFRAVASPVGTLAPGRTVVISAQQLIIKGVPADEIPAEKRVDAGEYFPPTWIQPIHQDDPFEYTLDGDRNWISFSCLYSPSPCRGIYRLEGDELTIRLGLERPRSIDGPVKKGESLLRLKRSDATDMKLPAKMGTKSIERIASDLLEKPGMLSDMTASIMETYDANHDGHMTADEWEKIEEYPGTSLPRFPDPDGDGKLTEAELEMVLREILQDARDIVVKFDADKDGQLAFWELGNFLFDSRRGQDQIPGGSGRSASRPRGKSMLILVDQLGGITLFVDDDELYVRKSFDAAAEEIEKVVAARSVSMLSIHIHSAAPRPIVDSVHQAMQDIKVDAVNYRTGGYPALAPVRLDFRIAATRKTDEVPGLTDEEIDLLKRMRNVPQSTNSEKSQDSLAAKYTWLPIAESAVEEVTSGHDNLIIGAFPEKHLLVSTGPDSVMLDSDTGERAWKVLVAELVDRPAEKPSTDPFEHTAEISLTLDEAGGRRLGELTAEHVGRPLAVVINDRVYMAPRIRSEIGNRVQITGKFSENLARELVEAFNKGAAQTARQ